jgi:glycosyltransferase involved in cell wall biosynthesis
MPKKKIVFIITKSNWGGAQKYVYELATSLPAAIFDCLVILGGDGELKQALEKKMVRTVSLKYLERNVSLKKEFIVLRELVSILKKEKPDIIHLNSSKIGGLGSLAGRIAGVKKIIFTAHGWAFKEPRSIMSRAAIKFLSWLTIIFSHKVIVLSKTEKKFVESWPFCQSKLEIIPIGVNNINFIGKNEARKKLHIEDNNSVIAGNIAELHKNKGLEYAAQAFSKLKDRKIIYEVIGEGEEKKALEGLISSLGIQEKMKLIGKIENGAILLKAFDLFLFPSVKEGLPYTLLEAGLASLPVIATNVGGIPEVITDKENGLLIPPKDPEAIIEAINFYVSNPEKAKEFGNKLREKVLKDFSLEQMVSKTIKIYESQS